MTPKPIPPNFARLPKCWPRRHMAVLPSMQGPSLAAANELLPAALSGGILILCGDRGRGKTQMATYWAAQRSLAGSTRSAYVRAFDLFATIKQAWDRSGKSTTPEWQTLDSLKAAEFLVIDELHERSESDWENRTLTNIIDHRYAENLPTVLISNLPNAQLQASLGPSIIDRAAETGGVVTCDWGSYR
jgi:DNA replication protein DnaC